MELRQFKYVNMVAQCGSVTKAARKLFISQPALSSYINKLEEELGVKLFDRSATPLVCWEINACMAPSKQPSTPAIPAIRAMAAPERIRTILASRFFKIAAKVIKTISAPAQTIKYLLKI